MDLGEYISEWQKYIHTFDFTPGVTPFAAIQWPIAGSIFYLIMLFTVPKFMEKREKFTLNFILSAHNLILSVGSGIMFVMTVYYLIPIFRARGLFGLACDPTRQATTGPHVFWYYIFYLSKYYEFFDTLFQMLKKRKVIFLHSYHHVITLWLVYSTMYTRFSTQWGDIVANALVHTVMYYYYYLTERGTKVWWKQHITHLQIFQFVFDLASHFSWYYYNSTTPGGCPGAMWVFHWANFVIFSFLVLFIQFYLSNYKKNGGPVIRGEKKD